MNGESVVTYSHIKQRTIGGISSQKKHRTDLNNFFFQSDGYEYEEIKKKKKIISIFTIHLSLWLLYQSILLFFQTLTLWSKVKLIRGKKSQQMTQFIFKNIDTLKLNKIYENDLYSVTHTSHMEYTIIITHLLLLSIINFLLDNALPTNLFKSPADRITRFAFLH